MSNPATSGMTPDDAAERPPFTSQEKSSASRDQESDEECRQRYRRLAEKIRQWRDETPEYNEYMGQLLDELLSPNRER